MTDTGYQAMFELKVKLMERFAEMPNRKQFTMRLAKPDTWIIRPFNPSPDTPHPHVLIGEKSALVIDPTDTPYDLRRFIEENVTSKPLVVANTHSHRDHTYANYLFDDCTIYMSEKCQEDLKTERENPRINGQAKRMGLTKVSANEGTAVHGGDRIDLGGRQIEVLEINNCHSDSSILFLDHGQGILFPGDEIDPGQINMWNTPVETFRDNMIALKARRDEFDMICAPHNGTPMHADILDYFIENCDRIMSGIEGEEDVASFTYLLNPFEPRDERTVEYRRYDPVTRRSFWKGTALNYNVDLIWNKQLEGTYRKASPRPPKDV